MRPPPRKPPPDSRANILGRMAQLRKQAHDQACGGVIIVMADEKGKAPKLEPRKGLPEDYAKKLAAALKELEPQMKKLERRLKKCPKVEPKKAKPKAKKVTKKKVTKKPSPPAVNGKKNLASSILDAGDTHEPLSREAALAEAVKPQKGSSLLDFMQSTLDQ